MQSTVYLITCPIGLRYVGGTRGELKDRLSKHRSERSACRLIRDAIHRHGWENMQISILMRCPVGSLNQNESLYIEALDTVHPRGYNLRCGSKAGAPSPCGTELSTLVLGPTEAMGEMRKAVEDDLEDITGTRPPSMTWSGPVSVSIADLNRKNSASMNLPWAGPVKGIPIVAESIAREGRAGHQARMDDIDYQEERHISSAKTFVACTKTFVACTGERLKLLKQKLEIAESVGMHDKAAALKRKLSDMLDV